MQTVNLPIWPASQAHATSQAKPNGYTLHTGKVAGQAYSVIVTGVTRASDNSKTGDMLQVWIMLDNIDPVQGVQSGLDASTICRGCPFASGNGCYVNVGQAPLGIWRAAKNGAYPALAPSQYASVFAGRAVRFGAYGNPTLIPLAKVKAIAAVCDGWTGYFHDWRSNRLASEYARYFMASTETGDSYKLAQSLGYRTFHASPEQPAGARECLCRCKRLDVCGVQAVRWAQQGPADRHMDQSAWHVCPQGSSSGNRQ